MKVTFLFGLAPAVIIEVSAATALPKVQKSARLRIVRVSIWRMSAQGKSVMRTPLASAGLLLLALATGPSVSAQEAPNWMKQTLPDQALKPLWDEYRAVLNPNGALDGKTKQLIGLA